MPGPIGKFFSRLSAAFSSAISARDNTSDARRGSDVRYNMAISLEQAASGLEAPIGLPSRATTIVSIPMGIESGMRIRLPGHGPASADGGPAGDVYIDIQVQPHPVFQRAGNELRCTVSIPMAIAADGGTVDVPTLDGHVACRMPKATRSGQCITIPGKGMPDMLTKVIGDLIVEVNVATP